MANKCVFFAPYRLSMHPLTSAKFDSRILIWHDDIGQSGISNNVHDCPESLKYVRVRIVTHVHTELKLCQLNCKLLYSIGIVIYYHFVARIIQYECVCCCFIYTMMMIIIVGMCESGDATDFASFASGFH